MYPSKQNIQQIATKKKKIESINHNKISSLKNYIFTTFDPFFLLFSNVFSSMYTARNQRKEKIKSKYCLNTATRLRYVYSRTSRCVRFSVFVTRNSTVRGPSESWQFGNDKRANANDKQQTWLTRFNKVSRPSQYEIIWRTGEREQHARSHFHII